MALIAVDKFEPAVEGNKVLNSEYIDWGDGGAPSGAYIGSVNSAWTVTTEDYTYNGTIKEGTVFILTFASKTTSSTQKLYFYNSSTSQNDGYDMKYRASSAQGALNGKILAGDTCIFTFDGTYLRFVSKDTANGLVQSATTGATGVVKLSDSSTINSDIANNIDNKAVTPKAISTSIDGSVSSHFWIGTATEYSQITPISGVIYSIYDV